MHILYLFTENFLDDVFTFCSNHKNRTDQILKVKESTLKKIILTLLEKGTFQYLQQYLFDFKASDQWPKEKLRVPYLRDFCTPLKYHALEIYPNY